MADGGERTEVPAACDGDVASIFPLAVIEYRPAEVCASVVDTDVVDGEHLVQVAECPVAAQHDLMQSPEPARPGEEAVMGRFQGVVSGGAPARPGDGCPQIRARDPAEVGRAERGGCDPAPRQAENARRGGCAGEDPIPEEGDSQRAEAFQERAPHSLVTDVPEESVGEEHANGAVIGGGFAGEMEEEEGAVSMAGEGLRGFLGELRCAGGGQLHAPRRVANHEVEAPLLRWFDESVADVDVIHGERGPTARP